MAEQASARVMTHPSLMWQNHTDLAINVPGQVLYEEITADSTSTSGFSFNFRSPADNALLDNCVIMEYKFTVYGATRDAANNSTDWVNSLARICGATAIAETKHDEWHFAFRQCFPFARAMQNLSVTINGSNFNVQPVYWLDALNRLYFSEEEAETICSSSGGAFDGPYPGPEGYYKLSTGSTVGAQTRINTSGHAATANIASTDIPDAGAGKAVHNVGLEKRWQRFYDMIVDKYGTIATKGTADDADARRGIFARADQVWVGLAAGDGDNDGTGFEITVYERLPIAPFLFHNSKDARMSIPNIRQVNITGQFATNLISQVFQGEGNGNVTTALAGTTPSLIEKKIKFGDNKLKLHTRWYLTNNSIPPVVRIRAPKYLQYLQELSWNQTSTVGAQGPVEATFSNIQLDAIPDKFFIFVRRKQEDYQMTFPSEFYLSIKAITLTIGGSSGRLTSLMPYQMYENFLRQSAHGGEKKLAFDEWYKYHCVAILDAADIGLVAGPGYNYKTNLTVKLSLESHWNIPSVYNRRNCPLVPSNVLRKFNIVVLCCYNQHYIELNSSGGSKSGMTMIPRM